MVRYHFPLHKGWSSFKVHWQRPHQCPVIKKQSAAMNNVPYDHISIFCQRFNPKKGPWTHCLYATPKRCTPKVRLGTKWYLEISNASDLLEKVITRGSTLNFSDETRQLENIKMMQLPTKKQKASELLVASDSSINDEIATASSLLAISPLPLPLPLLPPLPPPSPSSQDISYWDSTKAKKIFWPLQNESDALCAIDNQIKDLKDANEAPQSYLNIVESNDDVEISENIMEYQLWILQWKCQVLALALTVAKENVPIIQNCTGDKYAPNGWTDTGIRPYYGVLFWVFVIQGCVF